MNDPLRCCCGDYKCKNPVISSDDEEENGYLLDPTCLLCEQSMCKEHTYFVREASRIKEFVCDRCYQMCMMAYKNKQEMSMVVFPVPPIEAWNALVAKVEKVNSDHPYINVAMNVLSEMRKYVGYNYAVGFQVPVDVVRLAIAIQRFVEKQEG